jgi:aminoglycoside phosphotransferase family enzyme/predicted kinase
VENDSPLLIRNLHRARAYRHPVATIELVETHISWVLLTGQYAYKIKKPVKFDFLDFSTLEQRLFACEEELRLNRTFAPQLYLDVVAIAGNERAPSVEGAGPPIEYAVRMRQFPQSAQLDRLLAAGQLEDKDLEVFGQNLALIHSAAPHAGDANDFGTPQRVYAPLRETLDMLLGAPPSDTARRKVAELRAWSEAQSASLAAVFAKRRSEGYVREGHGDLHLANLVRLDGVIVAFDCIEFNAALRWNDTVSDAAFLVMDLLYHRRSDLAYRFLNAYLESGGDYTGVRVLHYYLVYRALVRAKVAMIRAGNAPASERPRHEAAALAHIELASSWTQDRKPLLILMHGLSGSGKTRLSGMLAPLLPAIRLRSDIERKRLHGLSATARSGSDVAGGIYAAAASQRTYEHLAAAVDAILSGGESVIVDAAFLLKAQRDSFRAIAARLGLPCIIIDCQAPAAELERRLALRAAAGWDASEADHRVLDHQKKHTAPFDAAELIATLTVDTSGTLDIGAIAKKVHELAELHVVRGYRR